MADTSSIEWTDATWNPVTGCSVLSTGCKFCYAMKLAGTRLKHHPSRAGLTQESKAGPVWTGEVRLNEQWLDQPLCWARQRMIFVCAHGDLFHEDVPDEWIDRVFAVMALSPQHTFQVLTKRSARMRAYMSNGGPTLQQLAEVPQIGREMMVANTDWPLPNVWLGVSAERQQEADARIPDLLATPAAVRFVSLEPLLGPIDLTRVRRFPDTAAKEFVHTLQGRFWTVQSGLPNPDPDWAFPGKRFSDGSRGLDWVIVGGESGPDARPMHPDWARGLRDQCAAAEVPFFFKQWGAWHPSVDRDRDDPDWRKDYSNQLNDRHPNVTWLNLEGGQGFHGERFHVMQRLGKKAAGRQLDGAEHSAMPERRA